MQRGCPKKSKCNISGLRGQQQCSTVSEHAADTLEPDEDLTIDSEFENMELRHAVALDGLKVNFEREYEGDSTTDGSDIGEELDLAFLDDEDFGQKLLMMPEKEDGRDADQIPEQLQRKQKKCAAQHKSAAESVRWFKCVASHSKQVAGKEPDSESDFELLDDLDKDGMESWEDELDIATNGNGNICDWDVLRDQMKADLKRHSRTMTASQIHQLMILCNFATLQLKGVSCIDASIEIAKQWHHGKEDARQIIYPGANGDAWWTHDDLLKQIKHAIQIHERVNGENCQALFIFDNSSAHASLPPDALRAFEMNRSDGGKQHKQCDTIILESNPTLSKQGCIQKMTTPAGEPNGLQSVLEERGFDVHGLRAKCSPVCQPESTGCCMARLLSQQDDFQNQISMLEKLIMDSGHACIFLPEFHCELNPIEMLFSIGAGASIGTEKL
ncbi:hypothetical protein EDC04DRAFT_2907145 [Pisolithus marmoratus]|nr:hypothetical protein EDC04DRAFT_2907145 [Pisolithus marmoratus]